MSSLTGSSIQIYLFMLMNRTSSQGKMNVEKISKKLGEEAVEVVIAASQRDRKATIQEIADLEYHLLVLMADQGITIDDVEAELRSRRS